MPHGVSLPLRRVYFGVIFTADFLVNVSIYLCFAAVVEDGWAEFWDNEVQSYNFDSSSFDVMILGTFRALFLLYLYSIRESTQTSIPLIVSKPSCLNEYEYIIVTTIEPRFLHSDFKVIFSFSVCFISYKLAYFAGNHGLDITLMIFSLFAAIVEVFVVYARLRVEKLSRKHNRFLGVMENSSFLVNPSTLGGYYTFHTNKNSIIPAAFAQGGVDIRVVPNGLSKKLEWSTRLGEHMLSELNRETQEHNDWRFLTESNNAYVYTKESTSNSTVYLKSISVLPATPQDLQAILCNNMLRPRWDPLCADCIRVEEVGPGSEILHLIIPNMGPMSSRDLCCLRRLIPRVDDGFSLAMRTVLHQDRPEVLMHIRADMTMCGFQVRPHKDQEGSSLVTYVLVLDLRGWIPERISQLLVDLHTQTLVNLMGLVAMAETSSPSVPLANPPVIIGSPEDRRLRQSNLTPRASFGKREKRRMIEDHSFDQAANDSPFPRGHRPSTISHIEEPTDELRVYPNLLPRVQRVDLPHDYLIKDYDEFLRTWEHLYHLAVDLHLEDRVLEAFSVLQTISRSLEQHLTFARERITEGAYWKREGELVKILNFVSHNKQVDLIKSDAMELEAWVAEMSNTSGWFHVQIDENIQMWKRHERGRSLPTVKFEALVDAPLPDCLAILTETDQVKSWIPRTGRHGILDVVELARLTRLGKLIHMSIRLPYPMDDREVIARMKGYDSLHCGYVAVLLQTVSAFPGFDIPPPQPGNVRMHLNSGFLMRPVTKSQTRVTYLSSVDPVWIFPVFTPIRSWLAQELFTNMFVHFKEKAQKVAGSDLEGWMESQPDLYGFFKRRTDEFLDGPLAARMSVLHQDNSAVLR